MQIVAVTVDLLEVPLDRPYQAAGKEVGSYWHVLARVTTRDGIEGIIVNEGYGAYMIYLSQIQLLKSKGT